MMLKRLVQRRRHGKGPYGHLFAAPLGDEVMALDCETTGLNTRTAELVSVAAVPVSAGRVQAGAALGLRGVDLHDGVPVEEGLRNLLDFIGNRPLVGWCLDFDLGIINRYLRATLGFDLPNPVIELSDLYRRRHHYRNPHSLPDLRFERVAGELGVPVIGRHSARGDATTAALMYLKLKSE